MAEKQADIFLEGEAENWLARNINKLPVKDDPVMEAIESSKIKPDSVLEIGCSNGWRVKAMKENWDCRAYGIDPMFKTTLWNCCKGTADDLSLFENDKFDLVIYGWCLYLCDREDLFAIAMEGDRVLEDGGYLVIHDFHTAKPYKNKYKHRAGLFSYKMDYAQLWLANPAYGLIHRTMFNTGDDKTSITILRKSISKGWPLHE
ncbi:MAG TPA: methyltransferase domain-containing protein [Candidatus Paceibacterota bacterium]